jgi:hypothetical protein
LRTTPTSYPQRAADFHLRYSRHHKNFDYRPTMSTLQLLTEDLRHQPDEVVREVWHYLKFIELQYAEIPASATPAASIPAWPDFEARLQSIYGGRTGADSQEALDFLRGDRF